jgi:hypothetical protein
MSCCDRMVYTSIIDVVCGGVMAKKVAKTTAERIQTMKDRKKALGLVRIEVWVPADKKDEIKALEVKLQNEVAN